MPLIAIIAINTWISEIIAGSRVKSGSILWGVGLWTTKSTQSDGMSIRGNTSTRSFTCAMTRPLLNAVASAMTGVSSVFGPVYKLPSRSADCAATSATSGVRSMK